MSHRALQPGCAISAKRGLCVPAASPALSSVASLGFRFPDSPGARWQVSLKRERLELSPVYATAVSHAGHRLGYIRLVNFGAHAAADMEKAVDRLEVWLTL